MAHLTTLGEDWLDGGFEADEIGAVRQKRNKQAAQNRIGLQDISSPQTMRK